MGGSGEPGEFPRRRAAGTPAGRRRMTGLHCEGSAAAALERGLVHEAPSRASADAD
ncbi:hypothetical protein ACFY05_04710 [Microtetraspora fusca]|uniref:Uncharacterized protein n=1 Tax=Microtetraspora fusca TaxID=1997 RepID=A0ABW6UYK4_MICFU